MPRASRRTPIEAVAGCDLGTQSTKAAIVALDGRPLGHASVAVDVVRPRAGWAEQDPRILEESAYEAIRQAVAAAPVDTRIIALAFSGQMGGAIGLDVSGQTVTPYESWMDTRADGDRAEILAAHAPAILAANGIIPFVGPRVRRWRREDAALASRLARVVAPAGFVAARFIGASQAEATCDRTQANLFGCLDARRGVWDVALAEATGLPPALLPRLVDPTDVIGRLSPEAAARCGLPSGLPVAGGIGDGTAGWLAAGGITPGACVDSGGTSLSFAMTIDGFTADLETGLTCMPSAIAGQSYLIGFTTGTGMTHRWLTELLAGGDYDCLEASGLRLPVGSDGVVSVGHLHGRVTPFEPDVRGLFLGFDESTTPGHFYRSLLEALAVEIGEWVAGARRLVPALQIRSAASVSGGARSLLWLQIKADLLGVPFARMRPFVDATRGAALVAAAAAGAARLDEPAWHASEAIVDLTVQPNPVHRPAYDHLAGTYRGLKPLLAPVFAHLATHRLKGS